MGNRILKQSICTSETISQLSWFEEVCFYRLIVNADDYGRFEGRPVVVRSLLFPAVDVTIQEVKDAMNKLEQVGLIKFYLHNKTPYLQIKSWPEHHRIRNQKSKYPEPIVNSCSQLTANCGQLTTNDGPIQSNPIQYESNPIQSNYATAENSEPVDNLKDGMVNYSFEYFWILYPRKIGKEEAHKAYYDLVNSGIGEDDLCNSIAPYKKAVEPRFYSLPIKYLTEGYWLKYLSKGKPDCSKCHGKGYVEQNNIVYECECIHRYDSLKEGTS